MSRIKAVQQGTNGELIATAQALYPMDPGLVLDLTPGEKEGWWTEFRPERLHLLREGDFRTTGIVAGASFDHVAFDPPYVTKGGHETSTIPEMSARYGMLHVEKNPMAQWDLQIVPGLREANRLLKPKGLLWFKMMDYVTSGKIWWFTKWSWAALEDLGFKLVDEFILDGNPGPQPLFDKCKRCNGTGRVEATGWPEGWVWDLVEHEACEGRGKVPRRQVHAARAHSVLMIARKMRNVG